MTKRRGRRRSRREKPDQRGRAASRARDSEVTLALQRAQRWMDRDRPERARELLEPLVDSAPDDPDFQAALGYARASTGDMQGALSAFETVKVLSDEPTHLLALATLYAEAELPIHALRVLRTVLDRGLSTPYMKDVRETAGYLEQDLARAVEGLDLPKEQVEQGLYALEQGRRALAESDLRAAIAANRLAIKRLGDWPPPHNNLSLALFYDGQPQEALNEVRRVLASHPENLQALANGIRFLAWSGREGEARELWARLADVSPGDANERLKKAEAAAVVGDHESVYQTLKPFDDPEAPEEHSSGDLTRAQYVLAIAEANTGRREQAQRRLEALRDAVPLAAETLTALRAGRSGTGWNQHFRYFSVLELLPGERVDELLDLVAQEGDVPPERSRRRLERFVKRFPQLVRVAEKMIWEEQQPSAGIDMLSTLGTPEAYAALRRFATSQVGEDQARVEALGSLVEAGEIGPEETVRAWLGGEWREVELHLDEIPAEMMRQSDYAPRVSDALNYAITAQRHGDTETAEKAFRHALELDPSVKEAYNNLAAIYMERGEKARGERMLRKAVEIDPQYPFPVCNLAHHLIDQDRLEEAEELLAPLSEATEMEPRAEVFYTYTRARLLTGRYQYKTARQLLQEVLEIEPDHEPAQKLLEWIESLSDGGETISDWTEAERRYWEEQWARDAAWRERLQHKLRTLEPALAEALPLYTKDSLTAMAREVMLGGGWSGLRKAELVDAIIRDLKDRMNLEWVVDRLTEEQREALGTVLDQDSAMAWPAFDARYGNDLGESRFWEYYTPKTIMGQLRLHGLLVEATVGGELYMVIPVDLREHLKEILA